MMDMKHVVETRAEIRLACKGMTANERKYVKAMAFHFVDYLESVQRMPLVTRQCLYHACYGVFVLLLSNRQLARREGMFDGRIKKEISRLLSKVLGNYGDKED